MNVDFQSPKLDFKKRIYALYCSVTSIDRIPTLNSDSLEHNMCTTENGANEENYWILMLARCGARECALRSAQHLWGLGCHPFPSPSSNNILQIPREVTELKWIEDFQSPGDCKPSLTLIHWNTNMWTLKSTEPMNRTTEYYWYAGALRSALQRAPERASTYGCAGVNPVVISFSFSAFWPGWNI